MRGTPPPESPRKHPEAPGKPPRRFHREHSGTTRRPPRPPSPLPTFPHDAPLRDAPAPSPLPCAGESERVPRGYIGRIREIPGFPGGQTRVQRGFSRKFREFRHFFLPGNPNYLPGNPREHPRETPCSRTLPMASRSLPGPSWDTPGTPRGYPRGIPRTLQGHPGVFPGGSPVVPRGARWWVHDTAGHQGSGRKNSTGISLESPGIPRGTSTESPGVYTKGPRPFGRGPLYRGYTA